MKKLSPIHSNKKINCSLLQMLLDQDLGHCPLWLPVGLIPSLALLHTTCQWMPGINFKVNIYWKPCPCSHCGHKVQSKYFIDRTQFLKYQCVPLRDFSNLMTAFPKIFSDLRFWNWLINSWITSQEFSSLTKHVSAYYESHTVLGSSFTKTNIKLILLEVHFYCRNKYIMRWHI